MDRRKNKCSGKYLTGHCGGDDNMKCCIPKSRWRTAVVCPQVSMRRKVAFPKSRSC